MNHKYEVLKTKRVIDTKIMTVYEDLVKLPENKQAVFETVKKNDAAAIVPINEKGEVVLVRQYRHSVLAETLEIPAGGIEEGEDPKDCALRELEEETSFKAGKLDFMFCIYPAIGFCTEKIYVYLAKDLVKGEFNFDETEFITVETYKLDDAINLIFKGEIIDSKTIAGLFAAKKFIDNDKKLE